MTLSVVSTFQTDRLASLIADRLAGAPDAGLVVVIVDAGEKKVVARGKAASGQLDGDTVFDVGGLADVFVAVALADMVAKRELQLNDPVALHLRGMPVPTRGGKSITLEDLVLHRSGLPRLLPGVTRSEASRLTAYARDKLAAFLEGHELSRDIGAQYQRSPLGTALLAAAMSARAATSIEALLESRVFRPLGLEATRFELGALRSTPNDIASFVTANLQTDSPLAGVLDDARSSRGNLGPRDEGLGLGWRIRAMGPRQIAWGSGAAGGNQVFVAVESAASRGVVVMHTRPIAVEDIGFSALEDLHDTASAPDPTLIASLAGEYEIRRGLMVIVRIAGRKLAARIGDEPESTLTHDSDVRFTFDDSNARITFVRDASGAAIGLMLHRDGHHIAARKVR